MNRPPFLSFAAFRDMLAGLLEVQPEQVRPEAYFITDLGVDSLRMVELLLYLEELGLEISPDEVWEVQTVEDAYRKCVVMQGER